MSKAVLKTLGGFFNHNLRVDKDSDNHFKQENPTAYEVEHGKDIPVSQCSAGRPMEVKPHHGKMKHPFILLGLGDSFFVPLTEYTYEYIAHRAINYSVRYKHLHFLVRRDSKNGVEGSRVWKVR